MLYGTKISICQEKGKKQVENSDTGLVKMYVVKKEKVRSRIYNKMNMHWMQKVLTNYLRIWSYILKIINKNPILKQICNEWIDWEEE